MSVAYSFEPIGIVHSPFAERVNAPRQAPVAADVAATIELYAGHGYDHALEGITEWDYLWVIFVFHRNVEQARGWKAKVQPPRSAGKRGVLATRSPHRPNPIGLSAVRLERVDGLVLHVRNVDLLDGTPVLDIKPYVAYADAYPEARAGWLEARDPIPQWQVEFTERARDQVEWLHARGVELRAAIASALALGPEPHPYRRIRPHGTGARLAVRDWRADFTVEGRTIVVGDIKTGYRPRDLEQDGPEGARPVHREFAARWG